MVMVGFRGTSVSKKNPIYEMVSKYHLGGVVLYSRDLPSLEKEQRNVSSPGQLKKLNQDLQAIDNTKLLIAIDEEGGFVTRLSVEDGFNYHKSHQAIGTIRNLDSTKLWAKNMASELASLGINMNYGPVIDVNINPKNPIIGARERSFSDKLDVVLSNAEIFIQEHNAADIVCVPKHFPGHGSSDKDSHKGLTDVTATWSKEELIPFKKLIEDKRLNVVMTSHVYNENLDTLPATLSPKIIKGLLRKEFDFKGVIMSDDMQMRAISNFYDFETAIEKAINAGVDMLLFSNNAAPCAEGIKDCNEIPFDPEIAKKAITHIEELVEQGKISEQRINESYQRIVALKSQL
jgi:beta-N-acetylhexosaminidase